MSNDLLQAKMKLAYANWRSTGDVSYWKQGYKAQCELIEKWKQGLKDKVLYA